MLKLDHTCGIGIRHLFFPEIGIEKAFSLAGMTMKHYFFRETKEWVK